MQTSHDLMRKAMVDHAITAAEVIDRIHQDLGGDRERIISAVTRFVSGGPSSMAVCIAVIDLVVQQQAATVH